MAIKHYSESNGRSTPSTFPLFYISMLIVLLYSVFLVVHSVWRGVQQSHNLARYQAERDQLNLEVAVKERFITYQKTNNYIERQAREHFGYAKPDETVVILPENTDQSEVVLDEQAAAQAVANEKVVASHLHQWWQYFFGQ